MNNEINIEVLGPGWWMKIHRDAYRAITEERKQSFAHNIEEDCNTFPCARCKVHFRTFLDNYPLKKYWYLRDNKGREVGFFKWTWELHNQVNRRLGKYEPTFEEAYQYYAEGPVNACFNCGSNEQVHLKKETDNEFRSMPIPPILTSYLEKHQQDVARASKVAVDILLTNDQPQPKNTGRSIIKRLQK